MPKNPKYNVKRSGFTIDSGRSWTLLYFAIAGLWPGRARGESSEELLLYCCPACGEASSELMMSTASVEENGGDR